MLQNSLAATALVLALTSCASLAKVADAAIAVEAEPTDVDFVASARTTSMGPVCWAAILESISQYGLRCEESETKAFRTALDQSLATLDKRFVEAGWSQEQLLSFKAQMGSAETATEQLCGNRDAQEMYRGIEQIKPSDLTGFTEELAKRPGSPEWGTCL